MLTVKFCPDLLPNAMFTESTVLHSLQCVFNQKTQSPAKKHQPHSTFAATSFDSALRYVLGGFFA